MTNTGAEIEADPATGPYDGSAATLVGVLNASDVNINSLAITADSGIFAFAGDGVCSGRFAFFRPPSGCPNGATGYEGPGTAFSAVNSTGTAGTVTFRQPLPPGKTAYFSLAQALAASSVAGGQPTLAELGGAPNPAEQQAACSSWPVNCATGQLWTAFTDFSISGLGVPLGLTRTYVSGMNETDSPFGYGWTDSYAMRLDWGPGGTETVVQEDGAQVTFHRDSAGQYQAPSRVGASLTVDAGSSSVAQGSFTYSRFGSRVRYHFDKAGELTSETDGNGNVTRLRYSPNGALIQVTDPAGRALVFSYQGPYVSQVTDPMGRTVSYGYHGGNLAWTKDTAGEMWQFGYQPGTHLLASVTDPRRDATRVRYLDGRVASVSEPGLGTTTWKYAGDAARPQGGTTTERGPGAEVTTYDYRSLELTAVTAGTGTPGASTTGYTYTTGLGGGQRAGLVSSQTDPELHATSYQYDEYGNLTSETNALGQTTRYTYDGQWGRVTSIALPGPNGLRQSYGYDPATGDLTSATDGVGNLTQYRYGGPGSSELTSVTGDGGEQEQLSYDAFGDVVSQAVATGNGTDTTKYAYNADSQLTCTAAPAAVAAGVSCPSAGWGTPPHVSGTEAFGYNNIGEQTSVTGTTGSVSKMTYDRDGDLSTSTDPQGVVTGYQYNPAGEETQKSTWKQGDPGAHSVVTTLAYGAGGVLKYQTTGPADRTEDTYDVLGRLIRVTDPLRESTTYGYGRDGELTSATSPSGQVTRYAYDAAGELTQVSYGSALTPAVTYAYFPDGQPSSMTDGSGVTAYAYDADGRLLSAARTVGGATSSYSYQYEDTADSTVLTYPNGQQVTDTYNPAGRLIKVTDWLGHKVSFGYAPGGALSGETFPGGVHATDAATQDGDTLKVTSNGATVAAFSDTRNSDGLLSSVSTTGMSGSTTATSYQYTMAEQLGKAGGSSYQYDQAGNLTSDNGVAQQFNAAGELTPQSGDTYNQAGDLVRAAQPGEASREMSYNQAGELTSYRQGAKTAQYAYDGEGLLASENAAGQVTDYTWDISQSVPALLAAGGTSYVYGPNGQPIEQVTGSKATFLVSDQQGSTRLLTSESGAIVGAYSYTPYGTAQYSCPASQAGQCSTTALGYDGQYTDSESGYLYLRARYYNPSTGQFLTRDPAAAQTLEPYGYAGGDPVNAVDPLGTSWWNPFSWGWQVWAGIGGVVAIAGLTVLTGGADLPFIGGAVLAGEGADAAVAVGAGAEEAVTGIAAGASSDALAAGAACADTCVTGVEGEELAAETIDTTASDPVAASEESTVGDGPSAGDAQPTERQSCWLLPGSSTTCRVAFVNFLKAFSVTGVVKFIYKSVQAGRACADPKSSTAHCANEALQAAASVPGTVKKQTS